MRIPEGLLSELLAAAGIDLVFDGSFWEATDRRTAEPLAAGGDGTYVALQALGELRRRLDAAEGVGERGREVGSSAG